MGAPREGGVMPMMDGCRPMMAEIMMKRASREELRADSSCPRP
jgi:hypothetical protein